MSEIFGYIQAYCSICKAEFDGIKYCGRRDAAECCVMKCYHETLAIMNKEYYPQPPKKKESTS